PAKAAGIRGHAERLRIARDERLLRLEAGFDARGAALLAHDGEDLVAHAEGDIDLPGHLLGRLGQRERHAAQVVTGHSSITAPLVEGVWSATVSDAATFRGRRRTRATGRPSRRSTRAV